MTVSVLPKELKSKYIAYYSLKYLQRNIFQSISFYYLHNFVIFLEYFY